MSVSWEDRPWPRLGPSPRDRHVPQTEFDSYRHSERGAVVQWLARPLVTPAAGVHSPDQAHY